MFGGGTKGRTREWFRWFGEEQKREKSQSHVNRLLANKLVWLCLVSYQHHLSCLLIKVLSSFLYMGCLLCVHVCLCACPVSLVDFHPVLQRQKQNEAPGATSVSVSALNVCDLCGKLYIYLVYMHALCVSLLGIHLHLCHSLNLGTCSSSLASLMLSDAVWYISL